MGIVPELIPYVGMNWREVRETIEEAGEVGRKELAARLQAALGRQDLREEGLVELIWLAVGIRKPRPPYIYFRDPP